MFTIHYENYKSMLMTLIRIGFGLPKKITKTLTGPKTLFKFHLNKSTGVYHAGSTNEENVLTYHSLSSRYEHHISSSTNTSDRVKSQPPPKVWTDDDINTLICSRCQPNPPTFRHISNELNRHHIRTDTITDRSFTTTDCKNKWSTLFPSAEDANMTCEYLRELQKKWPGMFFLPQLDRGSDGKQTPKLIALHIVWPWSNEMMKTLSPSVCNPP